MNPTLADVKHIGIGGDAPANAITKAEVDAMGAPLDELLVDGADPPSPRDCEHGILYDQVVFGIIRSEEDGVIVGRQVRLRVRCGTCGLPFDVDPASARDPQDNPIGVVLDLTPLPET